MALDAVDPVPPEIEDLFLRAENLVDDDIIVEVGGSLMSVSADLAFPKQLMRDTKTRAEWRYRAVWSGQLRRALPVIRLRQPRRSNGSHGRPRVRTIGRRASGARGDPHEPSEPPLDDVAAASRGGGRWSA
jgi:hypothetical protein